MALNYRSMQFRLILSLLFVLIFQQTWSQPNDIRTILAMPNDSAKVEALIVYAREATENNLDTARLYLGQAARLSEQLNYDRGLIGVRLIEGTIAFHEGDFAKAKEILTETDLESTKKGYTNLIAANKLLLGNVYARTGDYENALATYRSGLAICEATQNLYTASSIYVSIGITKRLSGDLDSAEYYYNRVLKLQEEQLHDSMAIASIYNNIGSLYFFRGDYFKTEEYVLKALEINRLTGNVRFEIINLGNLGGLWGNPDGNLAKSMEYFNQAIALAKERGARAELFDFYKNISDIHYNFGKYKDAFDYLILSNVYRDSVFGEQQQAQLLELDKKYQTDKVRDSLRLNQQELEISQVRESEAQAKASRTAWQLTGAVVLLVSILVLLFFVYSNSKKQKRMNALLVEKNEEINLQKLIIEEKNTELTDSITYAKRIQTARLPSESKLQSVLQDHFLLFKPKDIVSGDFYYVRSQNGLRYFSVADCTGHGVPGAMVSMLGFESIEKIVALGMTDPAKILEAINSEMLDALSNKSDGSRKEEIKDGMDIAFCILDETGKLSFSGANNSCLIIRDSAKCPEASDQFRIHPFGSRSIIELQATSRPIGYYSGKEDFRPISLQLLPGDLLYLYSDGYADQFGGEKGKKLKSSRFREELVRVAGYPMNEQLEKLEQFLAAWQGNFDQLDDITLLGMKIS